MRKEEYVVTAGGGGYRIAGSRVSLDTVVNAFLEGLSPEGIVDEIPALGLGQVYGAIAFYLAHQKEVEEYLRQGQVDFEGTRAKLLARNPLLYRKIVAHKARKRTKTA